MYTRIIQYIKLKKKRNPAEMDGNGSKAYSVPVQFPVILCIKHMYDTWADPEGGGGGGGRGPDAPLEFWQKCAYRIREMVLV